VFDMVNPVSGERRMYKHTIVRVVVSLGVLVAGLIDRDASTVAAAAEQPVRKPWTLNEAIAQLNLYPRDVYLQYVVLQLARRENRVQQTVSQVASWRIAPWQDARNRVDSVDLFNMFSGALAIQESLQLDTMRGPDPGRPPQSAGLSNSPAIPVDARVAVASLTGPTIKSHPWKEMLGDKHPEISPLARCVPADFYFVEFRSLSKLLDLADDGDLWGAHLFSQSQREARSQMISERLQRQLALETTGLLRPFYDSVVQEIAITGSDLFVREGSDVTVLFQFSKTPVFMTQMEVFLEQARQKNPHAIRKSGDCLGIKYEHVTTPDRAVHVFAAYPEPNLHVRSNSLVALERVLEAIRGKNAQDQTVTRLGDTTEFAFIRTLMPRGAAEEDGFVYLSDPFIRRLVGPEVKLTARRRMLCYNQLRMIGHASLLFRTERGHAPTSLRELHAAQCSPAEFGTGDLVCPDGGQYTLSADGYGGACSHHGNAQFLNPCSEIPVQHVTETEATAYRQFLEAYNQYWRTFFDPIAIRIQAAPRHYRVETIVLPLIDNSIYTSLSRIIGGTPVSLDSLSVPKRNIFSVAAHVNKAELVRQFDLEEVIAMESSDAKPASARENEEVGRALMQMGLAWHNYHDTYKFFPSSVPPSLANQSAGLSWRVRILPFIGQHQLHARFHLNEPWDSEHNRQLIAEMPDVYRPANQKLAAEHKTRFVTPRGETLMSPPGRRAVNIAEITDGTSNTLMIVEADDDHAVIWTKPDDLEVDLNKPASGLAVRPPGGFLCVFADGSVHFLQGTIAVSKLAALFTRNGRESANLTRADEFDFRIRYGRPHLFGMPEEYLQPLRLGEFLSKGIGDSIALHVCDSAPVFEFNLADFLGLGLGSFQGGGPPFGDEALPVGVLIASLNSPIYISVPVKDSAVVDEFLVRLDRLLAPLATADRQRVAGPITVDQDYYQMPVGDSIARSYGFRIGPVKWRFFWARIGNGLYVASQPFVLDELAQAPAADPVDGRDLSGHGLVRVRPNNWQRVLPSYQLGWAENNREACLHNIGPLSSLVRAFAPAAAGKSAEQVHSGLIALGERYYDAHFFCPDGGQYQLAADGTSVECTLHGSTMAPRQTDQPAAKSEVGRLMRTFTDMTLTLTFLEDGLHAVVNIARDK
jgi:hypothetical protein